MRCKDCGKHLTGHANPVRCRSCKQKFLRATRPGWKGGRIKTVFHPVRYCPCSRKLDYRNVTGLCRSCSIKEVSQRPERRLKVARFAASRTDVFPHKRIEYLDRKGRLYRMRSSWEVAWARRWDEQGLDWIYEPFTILLSTGSLYLPDFLLEGELVEVKGPVYSREKVEQAIADGHHVRILEDAPVPA